MADLPDNLIIIPGSDLPPQAWSSRYGTDLDRDLFVSPTRAESGGYGYLVRTQPSAGGLYSSSLIYVDDRLLSTYWVLGNPIKDDGARLFQVLPHPDAKVLVIEDKADLVAAIDRWPHREQFANQPGFYRAHGDATIDWLAASHDVDAVWLTVNGNNELHINQPGLNTWDTEQVLWLTPAFTVGERRHLPVGEERAELLDKFRHEARLKALVKLFADPTDGAHMREWLKTVDAEVLAAFNDVTGLDLVVDAAGNVQGIPSLCE